MTLLELFVSLCKLSGFGIWFKKIIAFKIKANQRLIKNCGTSSELFRPPILGSGGVAPPSTCIFDYVLWWNVVVGDDIIDKLCLKFENHRNCVIFIHCVSV